MKRILCLLACAMAIVTTHVFAERILIDFGDQGATRITTGGPPYWNNVTNPFYQGTISAPVFYNLVDTNNVDMGDMIISNWYAGSNQNGPSTNTFDYPSTAVIDNLFNARTSWGGGGTGYIYFTSLEAGKTYTFTNFASRTGATGNREAAYQYTGSSSQTIYLNAVNNYANRVGTSGIQPDANGQILLTVSPGPNNDNADKFTYVGVIDIAVVPEPVGLLLLPLLALVLRRGH